MNNVYYRDLIEILLPCGKQGMKLNNIVRRIYNLHTDLFCTDVVYDEIYKNISFFLWRESRKKETPFTHTSHGVYAIKSDIAVQLDLFCDLEWKKTPETDETPRLEISSHTQLELNF